MSKSGLLSRLLGRDADEDDSRSYAAEEIEARRSWKRKGPGEEEQPQGFSIQRIAETIADLPSTVPREHAVLIVRRTLAAAGIKLSELDVSTRALWSKLSSEIELARNEQNEVQEKTAQTVSSLEEELRRAQEACEGIVSYEEKKISRASATLKEVRRVRAFFDLPEVEGEKNTGRIDQGAQVLESFDVGKTALVSGRSRPHDGRDDTTSFGSVEGSSKHHIVSDKLDN
ncbi:MAG: hypothetical protein JOZ19_05435 [Rubrobacter sp.]|nr:hypothetical protein [Rubrobacter sp.]